LQKDFVFWWWYFLSVRNGISDQSDSESSVDVGSSSDTEVFSDEQRAALEHVSSHRTKICERAASELSGDLLLYFRKLLEKYGYVEAMAFALSAMSPQAHGRLVDAIMEAVSDDT
jgi:hypothetical protein